VPSNNIKHMSMLYQVAIILEDNCDLSRGISESWGWSRVDCHELSFARRPRGAMSSCMRSVSECGCLHGFGGSRMAGNRRLIREAGTSHVSLQSVEREMQLSACAFPCFHCHGWWLAECYRYPSSLSGQSMSSLLPLLHHVLQFFCH
jgi:hypothetical protein